MVDDDPEDQELFSQALGETAIPFHVEFASNGLEALKKIQESKALPDIVFCDINMPIMNGLQMLEEIKKADALSPIPVIIYTTSSSETFKLQSKALGAVNYITKPSSFSKMCEEIKNALKEIIKPGVSRILHS